MAPSKQDRWLPNWTVQTSPHALERERESGSEFGKRQEENKDGCVCKLQRCPI